MEKLKSLYKKHEEIILYIVIGVATTLVYFVSRFISRNLGCIPEVSVVIGQVTAIIFAYITNKTIVFKSKTDSVKALIVEMVSFAAARGLSFLIDLAITFLCVRQGGDFFIGLFHLESLNYGGILSKFSATKTPAMLNEFIWAMISQVIFIVVNFILSKLVIFRKKKTAVTDSDVENV